VVFFLKIVSTRLLKNCLTQNYNISHDDESWCGHDPYWFWIHSVKGQGYKDHLQINENMVAAADWS